MIAIALGLLFLLSPPDAKAEADIVVRLDMKINLDKPLDDGRTYKAEVNDLRTRTYCRIDYTKKQRAGRSFLRTQLRTSLDNHVIIIQAYDTAFGGSSGTPRSSALTARA